VFLEMRSDLEGYMHTLKRLGIRDHQVPAIGWWTVGDLIGRALYLLTTFALGAIPHVMFNLPVMIVASRLAATEQKKALKSSVVKVAARDVVMSYKVIYVLCGIPLLFLFYGFLLYALTMWTNTSRILMLIALPFFAFLGMKASEQGVRAYADMVPLLRRAFFPADRREQDALPARRAALQRKLYHLVKSFGPRLGDLYFQKDVDWSKEMESYGAEYLEPPTPVASSRPSLHMDVTPGGEGPADAEAGKARRRGRSGAQSADGDEDGTPQRPCGM
ncbi:unnamed protein product, partial [Polarella glacialis]